MNTNRGEILEFIYNEIKSKIGTSLSMPIYPMNMPTELKEDIDNEQFIVFTLGNINDNSAFDRSCIGSVRVILNAYVKSKSRGRIDLEKYIKICEIVDNAIIAMAQENYDNGFKITLEPTISWDDFFEKQSYSVYTTSFLLRIY